MNLCIMMARSSLVIFALTACIISDTICSAGRHTDVLFVLHDAGESFGLQPVIDALLGNKTITGVTILTLGSPATTIYETYSEAVSLSDLGITTTVIDGQEGRVQLLPFSDMTTILGQWSVASVTCGMAYAMQAQICEAFRIAQRSSALSYYDSFSLWNNNSIASTFFVSPRPEAVDLVMTSADEQAASVSSMSSPLCFAECTGNPTLQSWDLIASNYSLMKYTRDQLFGYGADSVVGVVFAGGYGGGYDSTLSLFCESVLSLKVDNGTPDMQFIFAPHPGYSSGYEAQLFREQGCLKYIRILPEDESALGYLPTAQVISASNTSLSQCSTVGGQSLAVGVPHVYAYTLNDSSNVYQDVFTEANLIPTAVSSDELSYILNSTFRLENYHVEPSDVSTAGVPLNGTENILKCIYSSLNLEPF